MTLSSRIDDIAIWHAAAYELKRYGDDAIGFAARRAARLSGLGDTEGSLAWTRILRALEVLRRETPAEDENGKRPVRPDSNVCVSRKLTFAEGLENVRLVFDRSRIPGWGL